MGHTHNKVLRISAAVLLAGIGCLALTKSSYAASWSEHAYIDDDGVVWRYRPDFTPDEPCVLSFGFAQDPTITTVKLPSLAELKGAGGAHGPCVGDIDTYYFDANTDPNHNFDGDANYPAPNLTKIDMTGAAKAQVVNLDSLFRNITGEVEIVFGDDMVIGDPSDVRALIEADRLYQYNINDTSSDKGLFEGRKVKLTNLEKVKYIGWRAFRGAILSDDSRDITINSNQSVGGYVFADSNVNSLSIDSETIGEGFCRLCSDLTSLTFGNNAKKIYGQAFQGDYNLRQRLDTNKLTEIGRYAFEGSGLTGLTIQSDLALIKENVFENTHLGSLDFTGSHATLGNESFKNAGINSINFGQTLSKIRNVVFVDNNIHEVTLPKSIEELGVGIFMRNPLNRMTINFDLWDLGYEYGKWRGGAIARVLFGCANAVNSHCESLSTDDSMINLRHLTINPAKDYNPNLMDQYTGAAADIPNWLLDNATNIIPRQFFADLDSLETLTIGEGFQYIGEQAFMRGYANQLGQSQNYCPGYAGSCNYYNWEAGRRNVKLTIPDSVISIGPRAFMWFSNNPNFTIKKLPSNLEYVGYQAFYVNAGTIKDLNTKKLRYLGSRAFAVGINVNKIYLGDSLEYMGKEVFAGNSGYTDLTIDTDIYDGRMTMSNDSGSGDFRSQFGMWITNKYLDRGYYPEGFNFNDYRPAEWNSVTGYKRHYKSLKFTSKSTTAPTDYSSFLVGAYWDTIDLGDAAWETIPGSSMQFVKAKKVILPSSLKTIDSNAFVAAQVEEELVLPDTLTTIMPNAFMSNANGEKIGSVKITSLPQSLVDIGALAFYQQDRVAVDVNNPNLRRLDYGAFYGTSVRNVVLNQGLELFSADVFFNVPTLKNITIDVNLYNSTVFPYDSDYYTSFAWVFNNTKNVNFGTIKLTANAGMPCGGFGNCQAEAAAAGDVCKDQENNVIDCDRKNAYFYGINARRIDLSELQGMTEVPTSMFQNATVGEIILPETVTKIGEDAFFQAKFGRVNLPDTITTIDDEAFQWAIGSVDNFVPAGVETIGRSAFFGADLNDDLYIPAGIQSIGVDAFNAGDADVYYDTVSIEGNIDERITNNQLVHQMLWGSDIHTLIIHSSTLPTVPGEGNSQQFWNMPMEEVVITALPEIPNNAFESNQFLKMVVMRRDDALRAIGNQAFVDCENLHVIKFADSLANETVTLGLESFKNTGFETIGNKDAQFELDAAKFVARPGVFTNMQKLKSVYVPENLNDGVIPTGTFANSPELEEVAIAPGVTLVEDMAFDGDNKLERIIFWGDTDIEDSSLAASVIPATTNIYAYTGAKAETFANGRTGEGKFYPLDEVLYITTDKFRITLPTDEDFNGDVKVYALRRDGIVMESDNWSEYEGIAFPRADKDLYFMHEAATVESDPAAGTVFETPISVDNLDFTSQNFTNISYEVGAADENGDRYTTINYADGITGKVVTTSIQLRSPIIPSAAKTLAAAPRRLMAAAPAAGATDTDSSSNTGDTSTDNIEYGRGDDEVIEYGRGDDEVTGESEDASAETASTETVATTTGQTEKVTTSTDQKAEENGNPKTSDTILGYVALFASCSLLGGAAIAIIRHNKR